MQSRTTDSLVPFSILSGTFSDLISMPPASLPPAPAQQHHCITMIARVQPRLTSLSGVARQQEQKRPHDEDDGCLTLHRAFRWPATHISLFTRRWLSVEGVRSSSGGCSTQTAEHNASDKRRATEKRRLSPPLALYTRSPIPPFLYREDLRMMRRSNRRNIGTQDRFPSSLAQRSFLSRSRLLARSLARARHTHCEPAISMQA